jgi:hypothetical protein
VPAFNISDYAMFLGIIEISEEKNAPVILGIHPDEVQHVGVDMIAAVTQRAHRSTVPIAITGIMAPTTINPDRDTQRLHLGDDRRLDAAVQRKRRHLQEGGACGSRGRAPWKVSWALSA